MVSKTSSARWVCLLVLAVGSLRCTASSGGGGDGTGGATGNSSGGANGSGGAASGGAPGSGGAGSGGSVAPGSGGASVDVAPDVAGSGGASGPDARADMRAGSGGASGSGGGTVTASCGDMAGLTWKTAEKTHYTSYPVPGSEECIVYSGCQYQGLFAACGDTRETKAWVMSHNIASVFPDRAKLNLHDLCVKSGTKSLIVTVYDECGDSDCDGCCTENKGTADELIDLEDYTDARFGVDDGRIQWADLGPTKGGGCK